MRTKWLLIGIGLLVGVIAIAAVACDDDDENGGDGGGAGELTVMLSEMEGSGVTGTATLTETDDGTTRVVVSMEGLPEGPHANHIHHGTCDSQGEVHVTLEELQAGADGDAAATTTDFAEEDPDPEFNHFAADHYVAVHVGGNDTVGAVISCGNVE
jgi:Cu/Zn superoxide dismutase